MKHYRLIAYTGAVIKAIELEPRKCLHAGYLVVEGSEFLEDHESEELSETEVIVARLAGARIVNKGIDWV